MNNESEQSQKGNRPANRTIRDSDVEFREIVPFVDVIYGAVLSYGFFLLADSLRPLLEGSKLKWPPFLLLLFTTNYLVGDYVEARLYTHLCPYTGRFRLSVDLLVPVVLFATYMAASLASAGFLLGMASVFLLGGFWGVLLERDYRGKILCHYPRLICGSHFGAGIAFLLAWYELRGNTLPSGVALWIWGIYFAWCLLVVMLKESFGVPKLEADLLPVFPIDLVARWLIGWIRGT
jgi:hypothetical protein